MGMKSWLCHIGVYLHGLIDFISFCSRMFPDVKLCKYLIKETECGACSYTNLPLQTSIPSAADATGF